MGLGAFVAALEESGRVSVPAVPDLTDGGAPEQAEAGERLRRTHHTDGSSPDDDARLEALAARVRADLAHEPPRVSLPVARWALHLVWNACQALAHRALPADAVARALDAPCPEPPSPVTALSADLIFSVLPDLSSLARGLPADDPLRQHLVRLARAWPLSSVGADVGPGPFDLEGFVGDPSLLALYVDRILARGDLSRLGDPRVDEALRVALGAHPDLSPAVARGLL